jgi:hypothetical protein
LLEKVGCTILYDGYVIERAKNLAFAERERGRMIQTKNLPTILKMKKRK